MPNQTPRVLSFSQHDMPIDLPALERFRARGGDEREYILPELLEIGWSAESTQEKQQASKAVFNYRMVEVVMMLLLPLLGVALAIPPKRSTSALGVFLSIVIVVAYHKINQWGSETAELGRLDPYLALWGPFAVLAVAIMWMYYQVAYVPGGQAIGFLEKGVAKVKRSLKKLFRRGSMARTLIEEAEGPGEHPDSRVDGNGDGADGGGVHSAV